MAHPDQTELSNSQKPLLEVLLTAYFEVLFEELVDYAVKNGLLRKQTIILGWALVSQYLDNRPHLSHTESNRQVA